MSTVIKAAESPAAGARFSFDELDDAPDPRSRAAGILREAENQAAALRRAAEEQSRAVLDAAEQVLEARLAERLQAALPALSAAVEAVRAARSSWLAHWERAAVDVALAIAARVVRFEAARDANITLKLVREALELAAGSADVQLRMHPDDLQALGAQVEQMAGELGRLGAAAVVADASIERGGCRVDTRFGTIDQQFAAQLARIERELS